MENIQNHEVRSTDLEAWPALQLEAWEETYTTLHRWMQIVGKIRLALCADLNHWWHATLYVTPRGLTTGPMPYGERTFQIDFDFLAHQLHVTTADDESRSVPLVPRTVADFYHETMATLAALHLPVTIWTTPVEVEDRTPFDEDHMHASYDAQYAQRCWRILLQAHRVLSQFRGRFLGKASPVHFFHTGTRREPARWATELSVMMTRSSLFKTAAVSAKSLRWGPSSRTRSLQNQSGWSESYGEMFEGH